MEQESKAFQLMKADAVKMLSDKAPEEIAKNAGVTYDKEEQQFLIESLGKTYTISYPDYECKEPINGWLFLNLLHYLNLADGTLITNELQTMGQMPSGLVRGGNFDKTAARSLESLVASLSPEELKKRFVELDGKFIESRADLTVELKYLPRIPLTINIWFADDEFPPSARLLVDKSIAHYLTIEDAVTMADYVLKCLSV